jgi:hypothetical protein
LFSESVFIITGYRQILKYKVTIDIWIYKKVNIVNKSSKLNKLQICGIKNEKSYIHEENRSR